MSKVDEAIVEIDAELARIAPIHEGLRDYALLDLKPDTKKFVDAEIARYDRRVGFLGNSRQWLLGLKNDGHPGLAPAEVPKEVYADLEENQKTIDAAFGQFGAEEATAMGLKAGTVRPKTDE